MKPISPMRGMLPAGIALIEVFSLLAFGYLGEGLTVIKLRHK